LTNLVIKSAVHSFAVGTDVWSEINRVSCGKNPVDVFLRKDKVYHA